MIYNNLCIFLLAHHKVLLTDAYDQKHCREGIIQQNPTNCRSFITLFYIENRKDKNKTENA